MNKLSRVFIIHLILFYLLSNFNIRSQELNFNNSFEKNYFNLQNSSLSPSYNNNYFFSNNFNSTFPIALGIVGILYLINPIILFENDKIAAGFTKEFSIGFGYFGENRVGLEYSYIFRKNQKNILRLSYKYDLLLDNKIKPSNNPQGVSVISFGGGYYTDFDGFGFFPEVSYGYSLRNDKFLVYPNLKLRYTFTSQEKSNIVDFSFGIIVGIANPFYDLNIRRKY